MFLYILLMALIYHLLLFYLLFTFCLLMDGDIYQSTAYICLGNTLMGIRYQQCGTGETLLLKMEAKLLQTLWKLTGHFNTVLWSSSVGTYHPHVMRFDGKGKGKKKWKRNKHHYNFWWKYLILLVFFSAVYFFSNLPLIKAFGVVSFPLLLILEEEILCLIVFLVFVSLAGKLM